MDVPSSPRPCDRLRQERIRHNYRQQDVADYVGTTVSTVKRWERGSQQPGPYYRAKLCALFGKSAEELGLIPESSQPASPLEIETSTSVEVAVLLPPAASSPTSPLVSLHRPAIWNVPFSRNPFFTGREEVLSHIQACLHTDKPTGELPVALCGLGGIGKTQTAVEYCYRFSPVYQAVLWARADTREGLLSDLAVIAGLLELPEGQEQEQQYAVKAVCSWLATHQGWLLVLDNVEDLSLIHELFPPRLSGHLLLTTHTQITGPFARRIELEPLTGEEGILLLLRRCGQVHLDAQLEQVPASQWHLARQLSTLFDGLPLALDQAGAYIEETGCSLSHYLHSYQTLQKALLSRRGTTGADHPASVFTTFSLTIEHLAQEHPLAVDLLRLCAFLHPDAIPEELLAGWISDDPSALTAPTAYSLQLLDTILATLRRYSLLKRDAEARTLTIHRLVQAVLKEQMDEKDTHYWANAAVEVVNHAFPHVEALTTWEYCQRLLVQALACATLIEQEEIISLAAGRLLHETSTYLLEMARYAQAERCITRALSIRKQILGEEHPVVAESLNHLAELFYYRGQYRQAEQLHRQALAIRRACLEPNHPDVLISQNNLASMYWVQGRYHEAELLYRQTLQQREQIYGPDHLDVAESMQNLASLYVQQERYEEAEPLYQRCLHICQQQLEHDHAYLTTILNNLGKLYQRQSKYEQAEALYQQALAICQRRFSPDHPRFAMTYGNLAELAYSRGDYTQAEALYRQAVQIEEQSLGPEHLRVARHLYSLAQLYQTQGCYPQAAKLYQRIVALYEKILGSDHPETTTARTQYMRLLSQMQSGVTRNLT
jgi:tetratricopeptide (TPR) repeat protein/transcriptional regulator with XRE-family HTH domain